MRIGQPVWHVVTGPDCIGIVKELNSLHTKAKLYARVHWLPGCEAEVCAGNWDDADDDWYQAQYLRKVGEEE